MLIRDEDRIDLEGVGCLEDGWAVLGADSPSHQVDAEGGHEAMGQALRELGVEFEVGDGEWSHGPERLYLAKAAGKLAEVAELARAHGQEAIIANQGGQLGSLRLDGPRWYPVRDYSWSHMQPIGPFIYAPGRGYLTLKFS